MSKQQQFKKNRVKRKTVDDYKLERNMKKLMPKYLSTSRCKETGKRQYNRVEAGEKLYNAIWLRLVCGYEERSERNIYKCPYCNAWHLTSQQGTFTELYETAVRDNGKEK